jgi:hypothetical protein
VSGEPHSGQSARRGEGPSCSGIGPAGRTGAVPGGAMPASASFRRPSGVIQSVLHGGDSTVRTSTCPYPASCSACTRSARMTPIAGQPE